MNQEAHPNDTPDPAREALLKLRREVEARRDKARARGLTTSGPANAIVGGKELAYDTVIRLIDDQLIREDQERLSAL